MGPLQTPKTTKKCGFGLFTYPPKIIKNRLNFALSEKFKYPAKTVFLPEIGNFPKIFILPVYAGPPPKIIKNRLNFAHSEICEKFDFNRNFFEIKPP